LADFRVKQLSSELFSASLDIPEENETQRDAQNKMYCHSPMRSSSKRPWKDSDSDADDETNPYCQWEEDFGPGERSLAPRRVVTLSHGGTSYSQCALERWG
jgi:hypothetical protein